MYFIIGAHKTGTCSIGQALKELKITEFIGLKKYYKYYGIYFYNDMNDIFQKMSTDESFNMDNEIQNKLYFKDSPWNHFDNYKLINDKYPNSKFILTIRDSNKWFSSVVKWVHHRKNITKKYKKTTHDYYRHLYKCDILQKNKDKIIKLYEKRNNEVINYFKNKKDKLLIFHIGKDSYSKLCKFTDMPHVEKIFPHLNINK